MSFIITKDDVGRMVRLRNGASAMLTCWDTGDADYPATIESAPAGGTFQYAASGRLYLSFTHPFDAVGFVDEEEKESLQVPPESPATVPPAPLPMKSPEYLADFVKRYGLVAVPDQHDFDAKNCGVCALNDTTLCMCAPCGPHQVYFTKAVPEKLSSIADTTVGRIDEGPVVLTPDEKALLDRPTSAWAKCLLPRNGSASESDPTGRAPGSPGAKLDAGKAPVLRGVIQYFPRAILAVAEVSAHGASKYTWNGWETVPDGPARYGDALVRHLCKEAIEGPTDKDSHLAHAAHCAWNALARLELLLREKESKDTAS